MTFLEAVEKAWLKGLLYILHKANAFCLFTLYADSIMMSK